MHRHIIALVFVTLILATPAAFRSPAPEPTSPNILFILSDDHRWDGLGAAGNPHVRTPNLDRLAAEGVHFLQATMHTPQCSPGRAQLLTGLPPHQNGWYSNQYQLAAVQAPGGFDKYQTVPSLLSKAGYQTVLIGKWHLAPDPWKVGFTDIRAWLPGGGGPYKNIPLAHGRSRSTRAADGFTQEVFATSAIEFLESAQARQQPFFLWLAFTAPHGPFRPNPPHIERLYAGKSNAELTPPTFKGSRGARRLRRDLGIRNWAHYYEAIAFLDEQVGRVLNALEEEKLAENTIVVFLGDNGFMMGSKDWDGKVLPYEDSVRVPLIIRMRAPGIAKVKGKTDAAASSLDLSPTFLRCAGVEPPETWTGRDLTPVVAGRREHGVDAAISEFADDRSKQFGDYAYRLIRTPAHKLILWQRASQKDELYDLKMDPHEERNLIDDPALDKVEAELRSRLIQWMRRTDDPMLNRSTARPNILWLIAEDFGVELGSYGTREVWTPTLDRLATEGVRYTKAFTTAPVCSPSRSAFSTGMYQTTIGAHNHRSHRDDGYTLSKGVRVASDWMRDAGYFTANVVELPPGLGFKGTGKTDWNFTYIGEPFDSSRWGDLKSHQPFFAQVNFQETHRKFHAPRRADPAKVDIPPYYPDHPVTRQDWAEYLDSASELDRKVGLVLRQLEADGLADNTVIIFFADNGQAHVRGKQFVYDSGLHVPLIIRWPKNFAAPRQFKPGSVDERLIAAIDLLPTLLDLIGSRKPNGMQGEIFLGDRASAPRQYVFGARDRCDETVFRFRTARDARYRYIRNFTPDRPFLQPNAYKERSYPVWNLLKRLHQEGKLTPVQQVLAGPRMPAEELYDLERDPYEVANLVRSAEPGHQAVLRRMRAALEEWIEQSNDQGRIPEPPEVAAAKGATRPGSDPNAPAIVRKGGG
jgi:arylsulfatase A-like enzyme